jgi:superfamily II DNA or RNA helicase
VRDIRKASSSFRPATAAEAARALLQALPPDPGARVGEEPSLAAFQESAVIRAEAVLALRRCVVIADGVGLGKTHIGLALARAARERGSQVAVIAPASLRPMWRKALRGSGVVFATHTALSRGTLVLRDVPSDRAGTVTTGVSRGTPPRRLIVDEAHAFRNPASLRYRALARLAMDAELVLLTATPINNSLLDLYFQLRLAVPRDALADLGIPDLKTAFQQAARAPGGARRLRPVLRELVIRRSRETLASAWGDISLPGGEPLRLPRRRASRPLSYSLEQAYPGQLGELLQLIGRLRWAAADPHRWGADDRRRVPGQPALLRLLLLKRLESSTAALARSVERQRSFHAAFADALRAGRLLRATVTGAEVADEQVALWPLLGEATPPGLDVDRLLSAVARDRHTLDRIAALIPARTSDPKLQLLRRLLETELSEERVLVFTEFADTAEYLWRSLTPLGEVGMVHGRAAFLGSRPATRELVLDRFAGSGRVPEAERVRILIATDVLAEGLNLQRASVVVSYDLPWNPVRLVQRIGRVDRIGSPHAEVRSLHFMPERGLEAWLRLVRRLRRRIRAIRGSVGLDGPVAREHDPRDADVAEERLWRAALSAAADAGEGAPAPDPSNACAATATHSQRAAPAALPPLGRLGADPMRLLLLVLRQGAGSHCPATLRLGVPLRGPARTDPPEFGDAVLQALSSRDQGRPDPAQLDLASRLARRALRSQELRRRAALMPALHPGSISGRAVRALLAAVAAIPGGPDERLGERSGALLQRLARPVPAGREQAIARALAEAQAAGGDGAALVLALEEALGSQELPGSGGVSGPLEVAGGLLVGALPVG